MRREDGRKQVLAAVLLHVVEAALPIDPAFDFRPLGRFHRRRHNVCDALTFIHDVHHRHARNSARIVRLAPRGRIKRRAVNVDASVIGTADHRGAKFL